MVCKEVVVHNLRDIDRLGIGSVCDLLLKNHFLPCRRP